VLAGHLPVLAENTDCHALLRADHANIRTVTVHNRFVQDESEDEDD